MADELRGKSPPDRDNDAIVSSLLAKAIGSWGAPLDPFAWGAALLALLVATPPVLRAATSVDRRVFLALVAAAAFGASAAYVAVYLRGGPRIIDATSYFLQGRALSEGHVAWPVDAESTSVRGRFLYYREDAGTLTGIFPPGYPALLALGFLVGAPMWIGPLLAAALVWATFALAHEAARDRDDAEAIGRVAALLSLASGALRYHTADTMSHGLSALCITVALTALLRARRSADALHPLLAGMATGCVLCTRFGSFLGVGLLGVAALATSSGRIKKLLAFGVAVAPFALLLLAAQRLQTGALTSTQSAYYAVADGPPGCFRYGFGEGIGCTFEHRDFVRANLTHGYDAMAALRVTGRRVFMHLQDAANCGPLLLVLPFALREARARLVALAVLGQVLAYAPFYFDGNYPGGGARLLADVLPAEHALLALGLAVLLPRRSLWTKASGLLALSLAAFALHASFDHRQLRDRDLGRPFFADADLAPIQAPHALVFVETDHAMNLAYDPDERFHRIARYHGDGYDSALFEALHRPPTYRLTADRRLEPYAPPALTEPVRYEGESSFPVLAQEGAMATPEWSTGCASGGRVLRVAAVGASRGRVRFSLPGAAVARSLSPQVVTLAGAGTLRILPRGAPPSSARTWTFDVPASSAPKCLSWAARTIPPSASAPVDVEVEVREGSLDLDAFLVERSSSGGEQ